MSYATRYEAIIENQTTGERFLLGYLAQRSRAGILKQARRHADAVAALTGSTAINLVSGGFVVDATASSHGHAFSIRFSGRTQLRAKHEGELPFIA